MAPTLRSCLSMVAALAFPNAVGAVQIGERLPPGVVDGEQLPQGELPQGVVDLDFANAGTQQLDFGKMPQGAVGYPLLVIGVNSAAGNVELRESIRHCWMQHILLTQANPAIVAKFLVAKPDAGSAEERILNLDMAAHPGEFLQVDAPEGYRNLTKKTVAFMEWFVEKSKAEFVMKLDDDQYPDLRKLLDHLMDNVHSNIRYTYSGDIVRGLTASPEGKYAQDPEIFQGKSPTYMGGPGYVVRRDLVEYAFKTKIHQNRQLTLDNEDVNTGLWIKNARDEGIEVNYQYVPDRTDDSCWPIGSDAARCCHPRREH